jgi:hypothetical protein
LSLSVSLPVSESPSPNDDGDDDDGDGDDIRVIKNELEFYSRRVIRFIRLRRNIRGTRFTQVVFIVVPEIILQNLTYVCSN